MRFNGRIEPGLGSIFDPLRAPPKAGSALQVSQVCPCIRTGERASSYFWTEAEIDARLDSIMVQALCKVWDLADRKRISLRTATFLLAASGF